MSNMFEQFAVMAEQEAQATGDLSQESSNVVLEAGSYYGYLFHYADIGNHEVVFKGESKGYHHHFKYGVALFDWSQEKGDFVLAKLHYEFFAMPVFKGARSAFMKMMNCFATKDKTAPHPVGYMGDVKLFKVTKSPDGKYNNVDMSNFDDGINIQTRQRVVLPMIDADRVNAFLWNNPQVEAFNKLNDFTKQDILNSNNFDGSKVQGMILKAGSAIELPKERDDSNKSDNEKASEAIAKAQQTKQAQPQQAPPQATQPAQEQVAPATPEVNLGALPMPTAEDDVPFDVD